MASTHALAPRGAHDRLLRGAYVQLDDLLAVRFRPGPSARRTPPIVSNQHGGRLSKLRGRGIDFAEVRAYQPGDDVRTIDWRVTARKNKPHTKVFREERERLTFLLVDQSQRMFFGSRVRLKSVAAAELAARAAWRSLGHNDRVGGMVLGNGDMVLHKPYRSGKRMARLLADIAEFNQRLRAGLECPGEEFLGTCLTRLRHLAHANYRIFLLSDFQPLSEAWAATFRALARHNEVIAVQVYDELERELPPPGRYSVTDGRARLQFHTGNARLRARYHERFERHQDALRALCASAGVRYRTQSTSEPVIDLER